MHSVIAKIRNRLHAGTHSEQLIRKISIAAITLLVLYLLGYSAGKWLFHIGR